MSKWTSRHCLIPQAVKPWQKVLCSAMGVTAGTVAFATSALAVALGLMCCEAVYDSVKEKYSDPRGPLLAEINHKPIGDGKRVFQLMYQPPLLLFLCSCVKPSFVGMWNETKVVYQVVKGTSKFKTHSNC